MNTPNYFRKGLLPLVVLNLLKERDMYGYEIAQEISSRSNNVLVAKEGALYPVLYQLTVSGFISERPVTYKKRMKRIYYHIESSGLNYLHFLIEEYNAVANAVTQLLKEEGL